MDVSDKIPADVRGKLASLNIEGQVLGNLLKERQDAMKNLISQTISQLTVNPSQYSLVTNFGEKWELHLNGNALTLRPTQLNRAERRALARN